MSVVKITISKVETRPSNYGIDNYPQHKTARVRYKIAGYCLYVEGVTEAGERIHFFTPQAKFSVSLTFGVSYRIFKNTGDFFLEDEKQVSPAIRVGQQIVISFRSEEPKYGQRRLNIVRLVKEDQENPDLFTTLGNILKPV